MTDLCDEDGAEAACELALKSGHDADATCVDVLVQGASLRIIQQRKAEAGPAIRNCFMRVLRSVTLLLPKTPKPHKLSINLTVSSGFLRMLLASFRGSAESST